MPTVNQLLKGSRVRRLRLPRLAALQGALCEKASYIR